MAAGVGVLFGWCIMCGHLGEQGAVQDEVKHPCLSGDVLLFRTIFCSHSNHLMALAAPDVFRQSFCLFSEMVHLHHFLSDFRVFQICGA